MKLTLKDFAKKVEATDWKVTWLHPTEIIEIEKKAEYGICQILVSESDKIRYKEMTADEPETYTVKSFSALLQAIKGI